MAESSVGVKILSGNCMFYTRQVDIDSVCTYFVKKAPPYAALGVGYGLGTLKQIDYCAGSVIIIGDAEGCHFDSY